MTGRALKPGPASDYVSRLRNLQSLLRIPLENTDLAVLRPILTGLKQNSVATAARSPAFITNVGSALRAYVAFLERPTEAIGSDIDTKLLEGALAAFETEAKTLIDARRGQERFRTDLFRYWQGRCVLTHIARPELLRASHIKPWSVSSDTERLDPFNGLLLAVHFDALFDRALISFGEAGEMLVSGSLSDREQTVFGVALPQRTVPLTPAHQGYMRHHRVRFALSA